MRWDQRQIKLTKYQVNEKTTPWLKAIVTWFNVFFKSLKGKFLDFGKLDFLESDFDDTSDQWAQEWRFFVIQDKILRQIS